jgi:hypothetical protein
VYGSIIHGSCDPYGDIKTWVFITWVLYFREPLAHQRDFAICVVLYNRWAKEKRIELSTRIRANYMVKTIQLQSIINNQLIQGCFFSGDIFPFLANGSGSLHKYTNQRSSLPPFVTRKKSPEWMRFAHNHLEGELGHCAVEWGCPYAWWCLIRLILHKV